MLARWLVAQPARDLGCSKFGAICQIERRAGLPYSRITGSRPASAGWRPPRSPGIPGCIHRVRTAASVIDRRQLVMDKVVAPHRVRAHRSGETDVATGTPPPRLRRGMFKPIWAPCAAPAIHQGRAMPPSGDSRTAAPPAKPPAVVHPSPILGRLPSACSSQHGGSGPGSSRPCAARCPGESGVPAPASPRRQPHFFTELVQAIDQQRLLGTSRFSLAFSDSNSFSRRASATLMPPYLSRYR